MLFRSFYDFFFQLGKKKFVFLFSFFFSSFLFCFVFWCCFSSFFFYFLFFFFFFVYFIFVVVAYPLLDFSYFRFSIYFLITGKLHLI